MKKLRKFIVVLAVSVGVLLSAVTLAMAGTNERRADRHFRSARVCFARAGFSAMKGRPARAGAGIVRGTTHLVRGVRAYQGWDGGMNIAP